MLFIRSLIQHILLSIYKVPGIQLDAKDMQWRQMPLTEL